MASVQLIDSKSTFDRFGIAGEKKLRTFFQNIGDHKQ